MPPTDRKLRVFLSYAKEDFESVHEIYKRLKNEGWIEPWQDKSELLPGEHWTAAIKRAIDLADVVIIFLSDNSINKEGFVHYEMNYAWDRSLQKPPGTIYRIPIRLDDCNVPADLYELDARQWADYFDEKKDETYEKLLRALKQRLEQKEKIEAKERVRAEKLAEEKARIEAENRSRKTEERRKQSEAEEKKRQEVERQARKNAEIVKQLKTGSQRIHPNAIGTKQERLPRQNADQERLKQNVFTAAEGKKEEQEIREKAKPEKGRAAEKWQLGKLSLSAISRDFNSATYKLIPMAIVINIAIGQIVVLLKLPVFLDSIGTMFVAVICGPWAGALTGALSTIIWGLAIDFNALPWWPVAFFIGLVASLCANVGLFKSWWKVIVTGFLVALTSTTISAPIAVYLYGGISVNSSSFIATYVLQTVQDLLQAVFSSSFLVELADKISIALLVFIITQRISYRFLARFPRPENI
jgi:energy-coupling factor transport system substrate-specific component